MNTIIEIIGLLIGILKLISRMIKADMHYYLLVMRRFIIEKIIAPIISLATFGFIRLARVEDNE